MIPLKDDNPTSRLPVVTVALVAANVLAFLWQLSVGLDVSVMRGGAIQYEILTFSDLVTRFAHLSGHDALVHLPALAPPPLTILTSMFLHGGLMHLAGNLLFLWIFGNNVEDVIGRGRFLLFYAGAGVLAAIAQIAVAFVTGDLEVPMVGASGAIAGVLGAYVVLFPRARVLTLVPIFIFIQLIWLPAGLLIGLWVLFQVLPLVFGSASGGIAYMAHLGGFVAGYAYLRASGGRQRWLRSQRLWG